MAKKQDSKAEMMVVTLRSHSGETHQKIKIKRGSTYGDLLKLIKTPCKNFNNYTYKCTVKIILSYVNNDQLIFPKDTINCKELFVSFKITKSLEILNNAKFITKYPDGLTHLLYPNGYIRPVRPFPVTLTHLNLGGFHPYELPELPKSLTYLCIYSDYSHPLPKLPLSLTRLDVQKGYRHPVPESTEKMKVHKFGWD